MLKTQKPKCHTAGTANAASQSEFKAGTINKRWQVQDDLFKASPKQNVVNQETIQAIGS